MNPQDVKVTSTFYDGDTPLIVEPTLGYKVPGPFTTRRPEDFPGVTLEAPVVTDSNGQQHTLVVVKSVHGTD